MFLLPLRFALNSTQAPIVGAKLWFTLSATNTPQAVYTTSALSVAHANPVIADGSGRFASIFLTPGIAYRVRLYAANATPGTDNPLEEYDPIYAPTTDEHARDTIATMLTAGSRMTVTTDDAANTVTLSVRQDTLSVFDLIPKAQHAAILNRTSTTDVASTIQQALDQISALASGTMLGATLYFPAGKYRLGSVLTLPKGVTLQGDGKRATCLESTHAGSSNANKQTEVQSGSLLRSSWTINSSTAVNIAIRDMWLYNTNAGNLGAGFYDTGGTFLELTNVFVQGFKYGAALDQSELVDIELCDFSTQLTGGIWLVNGPALNASASVMYTNRIGVRNCQFNQGATVYCIIDDGGTAHSFQDNNYNGGLNHIRAASVDSLNILGGEWEGAADHNIRLMTDTLAAVSVGSNLAVNVKGAFIVPASAKSALWVVGGSPLNVEGNRFGNNGGSVAQIQGMANVSRFTSRGNYNESAGLMCDGVATVHMQDETLIEGSATYDPASLADGAGATTTVTATGAALGDFVDALSFSLDLQGITLTGYVSAANTVTVRFQNESGGTLDLASGTLRVRVRRRFV